MWTSFSVVFAGLKMDIGKKHTVKQHRTASVTGLSDLCKKKIFFFFLNVLQTHLKRIGKRGAGVNIRCPFRSRRVLIGQIVANISQV